MASYLDAKSHGGTWLVRLEDLDRPREVKGAAERILSTLAAFGFDWPEPVVRQSERIEVYRKTINELADRGLLYHCRCSRRDLADEERYPGTCRERHWPGTPPGALRLRLEAGEIRFSDALQGEFRQDPAQWSGDFIVERRDGIISYTLAVVLDDSAQGITHVVRGADLLESTPRQIYLQRVLKLETPAYAHVPVLLEADGSKLAKSRRSIGLDPRNAARQLCAVLELFGLTAPNQLSTAGVREVWSWALEHWHRALISRRLSLPVEAELSLP